MLGWVSVPRRFVVKGNFENWVELAKDRLNGWLCYKRCWNLEAATRGVVYGL
jgi:hypothetical protein